MSEYNKTLSVDLEDTGILKDVILKEFPLVKDVSGIISLNLDAKNMKIVISGNSCAKPAVPAQVVTEMYHLIGPPDYVTSDQMYRRHKNIWYKAVEVVDENLCKGCDCRVNSLCILNYASHNTSANCNEAYRKDCLHVIWKTMSDEEVKEMKSFYGIA
jgi:hypothetical protein